MPLYEYECVDHGRFEVIRKFSDAPLTTCPTCGKKVEKLFSAPAFQFKGTGWYVTDYPKKTSGNGGSDKNDSAKSGDGPAKSGDGDSKKDAAAKSGDSAKPASSSSSDSSSDSTPKAVSKDSSASGNPTK